MRLALPPSSIRRGTSHQPKRWSAPKLWAPLLLAAASAGCSSGGGSQEAARELPPDCNAFVAKYEACLSSAFPSMPQLAKQRADQTRTSLESEVQHANLTTLTQLCRDNLQGLSTTCGASPTK
jgi:hypothetical protein